MQVREEVTATGIQLCCGIFFDRQKGLYSFLTFHKVFVSDESKQNILSDAHERVDFLTLFLVETEKIGAIMCT